MTALDTNVLSYACDRSDPLRQRKAIDVIEDSTAACLEAGVQTFYSEDQPGLPKIGALRIVNPFTEEAGTA